MGSEGIFGLQRAFKLAGAKSILMSLWNVPDKQTSEFMVLFYNYLSKGVKVNIALKKTREKMKTKYSNPYYWGAFVLTHS